MPDRSPRGSPDHPGRRAGLPWLRGAFTLLVSALAAWFLVRVISDVGLGSLTARLGGAAVALVLLCALATAARFAVTGWRWEILARTEAPVGLRRILTILMAGNLVSLVTPAVRIAGPILRAHYLSSETGRPRARFYGTIVADQTSNFSIYGVVTALAGVAIGARADAVVSAGLGVGVLAALVGGLSLASRGLARLASGRPSLLAGLLRRGAGWKGGSALVRAADWWEHLIRALARSVAAGGAWWSSLALSALAYALSMAAQAACFAAVGRPVALADVAFGIAAAGFLQVAAAAPGGPGVTEASLIASFIALGVDKESATAGTLLARLVNYAVLIPWGGACFVALQRRHGLPARRGTGEAAP